MESVLTTNEALARNSADLGIALPSVDGGNIAAQVRLRIPKNLDDCAAVGQAQAPVPIFRQASGKNTPQAFVNRRLRLGRQSVECFGVNHVTAGIAQQSCL